MLGISPNNLYVLLNYLGGLHHHLREKLMLFKPKLVNEACVQVQYLEKKGQRECNQVDQSITSNRILLQGKKKKQGGKDKKKS